MDNPLTILDSQSINSINPWAVMNAEVFLYYCCPECESRFHDFQEFENHALDHHPKAKVLFSDEEDYEDNFDVKIDLPDHGMKSIRIFAFLDRFRGSEFLFQCI